MQRYFQPIVFYPIFLLLSGLCHAASDAGLFNISVFPEEIFQGNVALIKISAASATIAAHYTMHDRTIPFFSGKRSKCLYAFLAIDLEEKPGEKEVSIYIKTDRNLLDHRSLHINVLKKQFPVQKLSVPESQVTLSPENLARYKKEQATLETIFKNSLEKRLWEGCFIKPLQAEIDTPFGVKRFFNNRPRQPHSGVDFKAPRGAPIYASASGLVVFVGELFFSGKSVFIDHGTGIISMYFHLDTTSVGPGNTVCQGDIIGTVGSTGRATGPHLHWSFRVHNQRVDPVSILKLCDHLDNI